MRSAALNNILLLPPPLPPPFGICYVQNFLSSCRSIFSIICFGFGFFFFNQEDGRGSFCFNLCFGLVQASLMPVPINLCLMILFLVPQLQLCFLSPTPTINDPRMPFFPLLNQSQTVWNSHSNNSMELLSVHSPINTKWPGSQ